MADRILEPPAPNTVPLRQIAPDATQRTKKPKPKPNKKQRAAAQKKAQLSAAQGRLKQMGLPGNSQLAQAYLNGGSPDGMAIFPTSVPSDERQYFTTPVQSDTSGPSLSQLFQDSSMQGNLGSIISEVAPNGATMQQAIGGLYNLAENNPQDLMALQQVLIKAGFLDPQKATGTTGFTYGGIGKGDVTVQALTAAITSSIQGKETLNQLLAQRLQDPHNTEGQKYWSLFQTIQGNTPITTHGQNLNISSPAALADQVRTAAHGAGEPGGSTLSGMAGQDPNAQQTQQFVAAAQQFQRENPAQVTTQYELGPTGTMRYPMEKGQTVVGGADQAAMDQFTHNWLVQNMGSQVAATGAANLLSAFNQLLGLGQGGTVG